MYLRSLIAIFAFAPFAFCADKPALPKGVEKVEASIVPADAAPGQLVTYRVTVTLAAGFHTYPLLQPDKAADGMVNTLVYPEPASLIFVGEANSPTQTDVKAEPLLGIKALHTLHGTVVYERSAIVHPKAKAGASTIALPKFVLSVCDKDACYPPKTLMPEASLKVTDSPAVAIDKKYAAEVEKLLKDK